MPEFTEPAPRRRVFILKLWETRGDPPDAPAAWRFSTQDPRTGERRGFASLESLVAFLAGQTAQPVTRRRRLASFPPAVVPAASSGPTRRTGQPPPIAERPVSASE